MLRKYIAKVIERQSLSTVEAKDAMEIIMSGKSDDAQIASFITALRMKQESVDEITGFAKAMREKSERISCDKNVDFLDTCGTGGDAVNTFNVSTVTAFVVSGAGVKVAKHGNRGVSSKCGSADLLSELGVRIDLEPSKVAECLKQVDIAFMFAPVFHRAMKYAAVPRKSIGIRTVFNMLGPLTNPLGAKFQLMGVFSPSITGQMAQVLGNLGSKHAFVVCGEDGVDEVSLCAKTRVSEYKNGEVVDYTIDPGDFALEPCNISDISGGNPKENAAIAMDILRANDKKSHRRNMVLVNSAIALIASNCSDNIKDAMSIAKDSLDSGRALKKLDDLIAFTNL